MSNRSFSPKTVPVVKRTAPSDDIKINSQMFVFLQSSCLLSDIWREGEVGPTVGGKFSSDKEWYQSLGMDKGQGVLC